MEIPKHFRKLDRFSGKSMGSLMGKPPRTIHGNRDDLEKKFQILAHRFSLKIFEKIDVHGLDKSEDRYWLVDKSGRLTFKNNTLFWEEV